MNIPGYEYGAVPHSAVTLEELRQLEESAGWTVQDAECLRQAGEALSEQAERMVDEWRAAIGRQPHLLASFLGPDGRPDDAYRAAIKRRFVQWVSDICLKPRDRKWLDYQEAVGLRHTPAGKNRTDGGDTPSVVPLRYLIAFSTVVTASLRPYLTEMDEQQLQKVQVAWNRAVTISIALWARPYASPGLW